MVLQASPFALAHLHNKGGAFLTQYNQLAEIDSASGWPVLVLVAFCWSMVGQTLLCTQIAVLFALIC